MALSDEIRSSGSGLTDELKAATDKLRNLVSSGESVDWRELILPASWRGVPFEFIEVKSSEEHSNPRHELPDSDDGIVETTGSKIPEYTISGFVTGIDWGNKRDKLKKALRDTSKGILVHPYEGELECFCDSWECTELRLEGCYAVFSFKFVLAGDRSKLWIEDIDTSESVLDQALSEMNKASQEIADGIDLIGQPARLVTSAIQKIKGTVQTVKDRISGAVDGVAQAYADLLNEVTSQNLTSGDVAAVLDVFLNVQGFIGQITQLDTVMDIASTFADVPFDPIITATSASGQTEQKNAWMLDRFLQKTVLATASAIAVKESFTSYDDCINIRDRLVLGLLGAGLPELAEKTQNYLSNKAAQLPMLNDFVTDRIISTFEIAQLLYGDVARADEIRDRNAIEHPGFIPPGMTLKVLSE